MNNDEYRLYKLDDLGNYNQIPNIDQIQNVNQIGSWSKESQDIFQAFNCSKELYDARDLIKKEQNQQYTMNQMDPNHLSPEIRKYFIIDHDNDLIIDTRDNDFLTEFNQSNLDQMHTISCQKDWTNYWNLSLQKKSEFLDAAEGGDNEKIKQLLQPSGNYYLNINCRDLDQWCAIHHACNEGHLETVKLLIEYNADLNVQTIFQRTPLHITCKSGKYEICQELLKRQNLNVNISDKNQNTALHFAVWSENIQLIELLIQHNADVGIRNQQNQLAINMTQNISIVQLFQQQGFNKELQVQYGRTNISDSNLRMTRSNSDFVQKFLDVFSKKVQQKKSVSYNENYNRLSSQRINKFEQFVNKMSRIKIAINRNIGFKSFKFLSKLGQGGFGEVYLVQMCDDQKLYAMKIMRKDKYIKKNLMKYAQSEKDTLSTMKHPFIVKLNYAFQTDKFLVLVMDYCPGGDLANLLNIHSNLPENVVKIYVAEITLALEALHEQNIIFRDLKPDNIVFDKDGHVLLTDFGLSKHGMDKGMVSGSFCGSPSYMAPEILNNIGHCRTIDWYLLGVCTYEMLVGVPPYFAKQQDQMYQNIKGGTLKIPHHLSKQALSFIISLLDRNPQNRLGAKDDGNCIRNHPWLRDINWQKCLRRELIPPKPPVKNQNLAVFSKQELSVLSEVQSIEQNDIKFENWDFQKN